MIGVLTAFLLASCKNQAMQETEYSENEALTVLEADLKEFTLIRSEFAEDYVIRAAKTVMKFIKEITGVSLPLESDWVKPGEEIPEGTSEILIGSTNRQESGNIKYGEYRIEYKNGRIVIQGGDEDSLNQAVLWFCENCISETLNLSVLPHEYKKSYLLDGVTLNGIELCVYTVEDNPELYCCDTMLSDWLFENAGRGEGKAEIRFEKNPDLADDEIDFSWDGTVLQITTAPGGIDHLTALDMLIWQIENRETDEIILNKVITMDKTVDFGKKIRDKMQMDYSGLCKNGPINIVAFGDSVTHGAMSAGEFDYETVYWNRLKKKILDVKNYVPVNVINAGIGGITAKDSVARMEDQVISHHPDLIIVCFGLNDVNGTLDNYLTGLSEIFARCREADTDTIFMTPNMLNTYVGDNVAPQHVEYAHQTAEMQNSGKFDRYISAAINLAEEMGIEVCDCYGAWKKMSETEDTTSLLANGVNHPVREMHELFAQMLFECIFD